MNRQAFIERTVAVLQMLPPKKAVEISAFAEVVLKQYEESQISKGIQKLAAESEVFRFLNEEKEVYKALLK